MLTILSLKNGRQRKGLVEVGDLKLVRPNVCQYKLLIFNYLQMFGSFRPPKQKYKRITNVQLLPSAPTCHNTMLAEVISSRRLLVLGRCRSRPIFPLSHCRLRVLVLLDFLPRPQTSLNVSKLTCKPLFSCPNPILMVLSK